MLLFLLIAVIPLLQYTIADYSCLCSYHIERQVYATPTVSSSPTGYLYEFDCKPIIENIIPNLGQKWTSIAFEHERSYVLMDSQVTRQICPGDPSSADIVTSTSTSTLTTPTVSNISVVVSSKTTNWTKSTTIDTSTTAETTSVNPKVTSSSTNIDTPTTAKTTSVGAKVTSKLTPTSNVQTKTTSTSALITQNITRAAQTTDPVQETTTTAAKVITKTSPSTSMTSTFTVKTTVPVQDTITTSTKVVTSMLSTTSAVTSTIKPTVPKTETTTIQSSTSPTKHVTTPNDSSISTKTTQMAKSSTTKILQSKPTSQYKQTTTDWTIVPWATKKTSIHPAHHQKTTHRHQTTSHGHTAVNVGNLNWCPRSIRNLQQHGTRNLRQHGSWCYELRREPNYNWMQASQDCISNANGFVVQIMSAQDQAYIMNFLQEENVHVPIWIGLNDKGPGQEEHFYWDSGAPVKYTNWDPNRKDNENLHSQEDCVILKPNGLWDDTTCKGYLFSDHHHPWICQYPIEDIQKALMSLKFGETRPLTTELAAIELLKKIPIDL